jgi:signal peptidase
MVFGDVFGYQLAQTRGVSMEPFLHEGDIVLMRATSANEIDVGEAILFDREGRLILHRVTETRFEHGGLFIQTKGDNNADLDLPIAAADVHSSFVARLPLRPLTNLNDGSYGGLRFVVYLSSIVLAFWRLRAILRQRREAATAAAA